MKYDEHRKDSNEPADLYDKLPKKMRGMSTMIITSFVFFILGTVAFFFMANFALSIRIGVALAIFLFPSIVLTVWITKVGDKPPPDAITVIVPNSPPIPENPEQKDPE